MSYKIEKDVPMPETTRQTTYPFSDMEVGDSFFAPDKTSEQLRNASSHWRKKKGWKFTAQNVIEDDVQGARIWRSE